MLPNKIIPITGKSLYLPISLTLIIIITRFIDNFLLFHFIAESFAIFVALCIGLIAYNTFSFTRNTYILYIGTGYAWIAILDLFHTLTFPKMNMFIVEGVNTTATIWLGTRIFEALLLLTAVYISSKEIPIKKLNFIFFSISFAVLILAFTSPLNLYIVGEGLTPLKNSIEYFIVCLLLITLIMNKYYIKDFNKNIFPSIQIAIVFTILAELSFTTYVVWDGLPALLGHVFKFLSFWIIFEVVVKTSLNKPMELLKNDISSFDNIPIPAITVSIDGIIKQVNKSACHSLKLEALDILENSNHNLFHPNNLDQQECEICKSIKDNEILDEYEIFDKYNDKYYLFSTSRIGNSNFNIGMVQIRNDITSLRLMEIEKNKQLIINEKIYKDLFELNESIILLLDPTNGNIINANHTAITFYGYDKLKLLGLNISDINGLSRKEIKEKLDMVRQHNLVNHYLNFVHKLASNEKRNVRVYPKHSIYYDQPVIFSIIVDVTDELKTKNELVVMKKDYKYLFNNVEVSIFNEDYSEIYKVFEDLRSKGIIDLKEYITNNPQFTVNMAKSIIINDVNNTAITLFKAKNKDDLKNSILTTYGENTLEVFKKKLISIWNNDDVFKCESDFIDLEGNHIYGNISLFIPKVKEDYQRVPVTISDITQIKEKDRIMNQQSKMAAMGEMIENIAHQWKQPLSVISTVATGVDFKMEINESLSKEEMSGWTKIINNEVQHLSQTIDDFRDFFKTDKIKKEFSLLKTFDKTLKLLIPQFKTTNIAIVKNIQDIAITEMENELIQVFINILNNARDELFKITKDKKIILIDVVTNKDFVEISIKDNAGGIPEEIIKDVFNSHFTTKEDSGGTGIGLYMSKVIIEEHMKGTIKVVNSNFIHENLTHTGAQFKIKLPLSQK